MTKWILLIFQALAFQSHAIGLFTINCEYAKCSLDQSSLNSYLESERSRVGNYYSPDNTASTAIGSAIQSTNQQFNNIFSGLGDGELINSDNLSEIITQIGTNYTPEQQQLFINNILAKSSKLRDTSVIPVTPYLADLKPVFLNPKQAQIFNSARLKTSSAIANALKDCEGKSYSRTSLQVSQNALNSLINKTLSNNINAQYLKRWGEDTSFVEKSQQEFKDLIDNLEGKDLNDVIKALEKQKEIEQEISNIANEWDIPIDSVEVEKTTTPLENYANDIIAYKSCLQSGANCQLSSFKYSSDEFKNEYRQLESLYQTTKYVQVSNIESHYKDSAFGYLNLSSDALISGDIETSKQFEEIATSIVDIGLGLIPVVSIGKDAYELFTGKNLVTGEELSTFERGLAAIGILTTGGSHYIQAAGKVLSKTVQVSDEVIEVAQKVIISARKSGLFSGNKFKELKSNSSYETVKSFFRTLEKSNVPLPIKKNLVKSFDLKTLKKEIVSSDLYVYRWHNNDDFARKFGRFVSDISITDKDAARKLLALPDNNKMLHLDKFKIKHGTEIYRGKVAPLNGHTGGGSQIFITGENVEDILIPILD